MAQHSRIYFLAVVFIAFGILGCDTDGEETMSWKPGKTLHIVGEPEIIVGEDNSYYVDGYTVKETYTWKLDGADITPTRKGEFVELNFDAAGTHTLSVTNGTFVGVMDIEVVEE